MAYIVARWLSRNRPGRLRDATKPNEIADIAALAGKIARLLQIPERRHPLRRRRTNGRSRPSRRNPCSQNVPRSAKQFSSSSCTQRNAIRQLIAEATEVRPSAIPSYARAENGQKRETLRSPDKMQPQNLQN